MVDNQWVFTISADADVVHGPLRRLRDLCEAATCEAVVSPTEVLALLDEYDEQLAAARAAKECDR
jgi:hypothetical protein